MNWQALVAEALRRRKAENLTQREHAALANVSVPTMAAFDRGEHTLTLAKAFDILRVVGLIDEPDEAGAQEVFIHTAFARWRDLASGLPEDSPGRFPNGWYRIDYCLEGDLRTVGLAAFSGSRLLKMFYEERLPGTPVGRSSRCRSIRRLRRVKWMVRSNAGSPLTRPEPIGGSMTRLIAISGGPHPAAACF